jgi:hypothetical protein
MLHKHSMRRLLTAGLAIAAIAPASAAAQPTDAHAVGASARNALTAQNLTAPDNVDRGNAPQPAGQAVAAGGGPGVTAQTLTAPAQNLAAPDQVDRVNQTPPADDGGLDTGLWIALGGAALLAAMGLGLVGRKRLRPRQLA